MQRTDSQPLRVHWAEGKQVKNIGRAVLLIMKKRALTIQNDHSEVYKHETTIRRIIDTCQTTERKYPFEMLTPTKPNRG